MPPRLYCLSTLLATPNHYLLILSQDLVKILGYQAISSEVGVAKILHAHKITLGPLTDSPHNLLISPFSAQPTRTLDPT